MKALLAFAFAGVLLSAACRPGFADSMMHSSAMMPACGAGDRVVGMNMKTKMYMSQRQIKMRTMGMTMDQKQMMMKQHHMMMVCKSKADSMGGMMTKPM